MELEQGNESDVTQSSGTESPETASSAPSQETAPAQDVQSKPAEQNVPYNRFQEVVQQKNQFQEQYSQIQNAYQQLAAQIEQLKQQKQPSPQTPTNPYANTFKELEGVNPEFAKMQQDFYNKLNETEQLKAQLSEVNAWRQSMEQQRNSELATSSLDKLYTEHKIPENLKSFYQEAIANAAYNDPNARVQDLPRIFKATHEKLSKAFDDLKRSERESYVSQKTQDKTPATQTGGTPVGKGKASASSLEDVKAQFVESLKSGARLF